MADLYGHLAPIPWTGLHTLVSAISGQAGVFDVKFEGRPGGAGPPQRVVAERLLVVGRVGGRLVVTGDQSPAGIRDEYVMAFRTPHAIVRDGAVVVFDESWRPLAEQLAGDMPQARADVHAVLGVTGDRPIVVFVYSSSAEVADYLGQSAAQKREQFFARLPTTTSSTPWWPTDVGVLASALTPADAWTVHMLAHEVTHTLTWRWFYGTAHAPPLLLEGMATAVEGDRSYAPLRVEVAEDMDWCMYAEIYDPTDEPPPAPLPETVYRDEKLSAALGAGDTGLVALDLDGGSRPSLIAWGGGRAQLFRNGKTPVPDSGLETLRDVVAIVPGDFDNDGLPDLCVITRDGAALYRNVNGHFQKHADLPKGLYHTAVWLDYDHDYDEDLFLIGPQSKLMRNNGEAGFSDETARFPFVSGHARDAVRFDLEPDTPYFDLVVMYDDQPGVLYRDRLVGHYEAVPLAALPAGARHLAARDVNRDGRTDLVVQGPLLLNVENGLLLLNRPGRFELQANVPDEAFAPREALADFDGNGRLDRARIDGDGAITIRHDVTPNYGNWIEVALTGEKNPKAAVNAKVEVKAGTSYEKITYAGIPAVFRLGDRAKVDTVRITWPNGLVQNETSQPVNKVDAIKEAPRLAGSCPMIFTWNGSGFQFITDVLGVAPLGASSGDGEFFPVDHQEYVSIPAEALEVRDGAYEVRMTEELREVSYIDQMKLMALDHPAGTEIVTNEKFKSPPFPDFRLFGVTSEVYPVAAHDSNGADVRDAVLRRDRVYPDSFRRDLAGVAELHHLDLDFGDAARSNRAALILYGWVDWADGSTFLSASQAHRDLVFPYLQVKDAAGNWKTVVEDMGMPSGKPKPMAVDFAGKFLSASREVRIVTNLCVYWDEIYLVEDDAPPQVHMTRRRWTPPISISAASQSH